MQGHAETGVGTKNCVVLHAVKMAFLASVFGDSFQVLYLSELWGFGLSKELSVANEIVTDLL